MSFTSKELLQNAAKECVSFSGMVRWFKRSPTGSNITHIKRQCAKFNVDTSHFTGNAHNRGKPAANKRAALDVLVLGEQSDHRTKSDLLRRSLIEINRQIVCELCETGEVWNGRVLRLQVDHKNERYWDNRPCNLRFLCPNCHTQETYKYSICPSGEVG